MDAARTALRLGAETVRIVYRRSREELPARAEEVHHAEEEGILFQLLTAPVEFEGDERGMVRRMTCLRMELGEPDAYGRRRPVPIEGSEFTIGADLVIVAIGAGANPLLTKNTPGLGLNRRGYIVVGDQGRTNKPRVWSGGDIVTGSATVIEAMGAGRRAAEDMHCYCLSASDGALAWKSRKLSGMSFRDYYPLVHNGLVIVESQPAWLDHGGTGLGGTTFPLICFLWGKEPKNLQWIAK